MDAPGETLGALLRLEEAMDGSLSAVIADTESSAASIIAHIRRLHESASTLTSYLDSTSLKAGELGKEIIESVGFLGELGSFVGRLPAKMESDLASVRAVVREIKNLAEMTADVKAISVQSRLLALNAACEATRAGVAGAAFKVVSDEMRRLAGSSSAIAVRINKGLEKAQEIVETGLQSTITESARQLDDVSKAAASIRKLQENFEDMSQYYKTRFAIVSKHNEDLTRDIANALGEIQYQDVVRQCIERIRVATARRNEVLRALLGPDSGEGANGANGAKGGGEAGLPAQLELILGDYVAEEQHHRHSVRQTQGSGGALKVELF